MTYGFFQHFQKLSIVHHLCKIHIKIVKTNLTSVLLATVGGVLCLMIEIGAPIGALMAAVRTGVGVLTRPTMDRLVDVKLVLSGK